MKHRLPLILFLLVTSLSSLVFWGCANTNQNAAKVPQPTVIYVVRHAEKETDNPEVKNPALSVVGHVRAQALKEILRETPVQALFASEYQRTHQTLAPLAAAQSLPTQTYQTDDFAGLTQKILTDYSGKTVVVAGHSNTVLQIVEALGAKKPLPEIEDHQYHYLFKITLSGRKTPQVEVLSYGAGSK